MALKLKISIYHRDYNDSDDFVYEAMGYFWLNDQESMLDAAEEAYRLTQNIEGYSWSRDFPLNLWDAKPLVEVDGVEYGHRSSMVGDIFMIEQFGEGDMSATPEKVVEYRVGVCGFEVSE